MPVRKTDLSVRKPNIIKQQLPVLLRQVEALLDYGMDKHDLLIAVVKTIKNHD